MPGRFVPPCLSSTAQRMEQVTCSLGQPLCFATGRDSEEKSVFQRVWQLWVAAMVHLLELTVLAEPLGCSAPHWVPVLQRSRPGRHTGPWGLPLNGNHSWLCRGASAGAKGTPQPRSSVTACKLCSAKCLRAGDPHEATACWRHTSEVRLNISCAHSC